MNTDNIFKATRLKAAKTKPVLSSIDSAASELHMPRAKLGRIEQEDPDKHQEMPSEYDIIEMIKVYDAPELKDHYCENCCPLGEGREPLMYENLGMISAKLFSSLHFLDRASDVMHTILADSVISEDEKEEFEKILEILKSISYSADSLELWARKHGFEE